MARLRQVVSRRYHPFERISGSYGVPINSIPIFQVSIVQRSVKVIVTMIVRKQTSDS